MSTSDGESIRNLIAIIIGLALVVLLLFRCDAIIKEPRSVPTPTISREAT